MGRPQRQTLTGKSGTMTLVSGNFSKQSEMIMDLFWKFFGYSWSILICIEFIDCPTTILRLPSRYLFPFGNVFSRFVQKILNDKMNKKLKIENRKHDLIYWFDTWWKGPGKALGKTAWSLEPPRLAQVLSQAAPMRSVREQPFPKRLAMRPRRATNAWYLGRRKEKNMQKNWQKGISQQKCPRPGFWYWRLGQVAKTISQRTPCVAIQPESWLCRFQYLVHDIKMADLGIFQLIAADLLPHFVFIQLLSTSQCLRLNMSRRASKWMWIHERDNSLTWHTFHAFPYYNSFINPLQVCENFRLQWQRILLMVWRTNIIDSLRTSTSIPTTNPSERHKPSKPATRGKGAYPPALTGSGASSLTLIATTASWL